MWQHEVIKEQEVFKEVVRELFFYTSRYGVRMYFNGRPPVGNINSEELDEKCRDGWKIAQYRIIDELKKAKLDVSIANQELKTIRLSKERERVKEFETKVKVKKWRVGILKILEDSILWQVFGGEHSALRRLYTFEHGEKNINEKSFDTVVSVAKKINEDPESICIISDLTSYVQACDIIVSDTYAIKIGEVKSGRDNSYYVDYTIIYNKIDNDRNDLQQEFYDEPLPTEALSFVKSIEEKLIPSDDESLRKLMDKSTFNEVMRILKQREKTKRIELIFKNDIGFHPKYKDTLVVTPESKINKGKYQDILWQLIKQSRDQGWAYTIVEGIVHLGVYRVPITRAYASKLISEKNKGYPVLDFVSNDGAKISQPIFTMPFDDDSIIDVAFRTIGILASIDFDALIEASNKIGLPMRWSTRKEMNQLFDLSESESRQFFMFENKGIIFDGKLLIKGIEWEAKCFWGSGMNAKIIYDQFLPSSILSELALELREQTEISVSSLNNP